MSAARENTQKDRTEMEEDTTKTEMIGTYGEGS